MAENKTKKKKGVRLVIRVVWGKSMNNFYFFIFLSKLMKKKIYIRVMLSLKYFITNFS